MPQLDFREALSTPDEKLFSPAPVVPPVSAASLDYQRNSFARGVQLSRSTWTNIFFVAIASFGGLVCAFYFFNGGELLRAAASWPSEFLYPRPLSTEKIDIGEQPNPIDTFASAAAESTKTDEARVPSEKNTGPSDFSQPTNTIGASNPTGAVAPVGSGVPLLPTAPFLPNTPSIPGGLQPPSAPDINTLFQPLGLQPVYQIATSTVPNTTTTNRTVKSSRTTTRRKVSSTRQALAGQTKSSTAVAKSTSQNVQQMSNQMQMPMNSIQGSSQMMSGGLGGGVGGAVGGVGGGLGGGLGGVGGTVGGVLGGHH